MTALPNPWITNSVAFANTVAVSVNPNADAAAGPSLQKMQITVSPGVSTGSLASGECDPSVMLDYAPGENSSCGRYEELRMRTSTQAAPKPALGSKSMPSPDLGLAHEQVKSLCPQDTESRSDGNYAPGENSSCGGVESRHATDSVVLDPVRFGEVAGETTGQPEVAPGPQETESLSNEGRFQGAPAVPPNPMAAGVTDVFDSDISDVGELFAHARRLVAEYRAIHHRFVLDEQAFFEAIEPLPLFLQAAQ